ncbi:hydrolase [Pseudobacillus badius]|uniref:hydrolase n=1 Tax=Bacillus badius TaxID=1455 RepID=UPI003CF42EAD
MNHKKNCCHKHKNNEHEHTDREHKCNGCICNQLRKLQTQTEVDVFLSSGEVLEDVVFINFDRNNCCAFFMDTETEPGSTLIVDCQRIDAIRIEAD